MLKFRAHALSNDFISKIILLCIWSMRIVTFPTATSTIEFTLYDYTYCSRICFAFSFRLKPIHLKNLVTASSDQQLRG